MNNQGNAVPVDNERLTRLETGFDHMSKDVGDIKDEISEFRAVNKTMSDSLVRLTVIAEQNQNIVPKMDGMAVRLEGKILDNTKFIWKLGGALTVIAAASPLIFKYFGA